MLLSGSKEFDNHNGVSDKFEKRSVLLSIEKCFKILHTCSASCSKTVLRRFISIMRLLTLI